MSSPFRYPGGKSKAVFRTNIRVYRPQRYNEYREPFVGGGGIFFAEPITKKRWINDLDSGLISVYEALRDCPAEFIAECRCIAPQLNGEALIAARNGKPMYSERLKRIYDMLLAAPPSALRWYFINRTNWAGRMNFDIPSRMYFSCPEGWNITRTNALEIAASKMRGVRITNSDYASVLDEPGDDVFIYADPPYYVNTELGTASQLYRHNFNDEDHVRFAEVVRRCNHRVCISYDDHPRIRELFAGMWFNTFTTTYCGTAPGVEKRKGVELIITNYDPAHHCELQRSLWPVAPNRRRITRV